MLNLTLICVIKFNVCTGPLLYNSSNTFKHLWYAKHVLIALLFGFRMVSFDFCTEIGQNKNNFYEGAQFLFCFSLEMQRQRS